MNEGLHLALETPAAAMLLLCAPLLIWPLFRLQVRRVWIAPALLRIAAFVLVVFALAGLSFERKETVERVCIVVATDLSDHAGPVATSVGRQWLERLSRRLSADDSLGEVAFGRQAEVIASPASPPRLSAAEGVRIDSSASSLEAGIEAALPLCPEAVERKVLLVTDGNETLGDARRAASLARQMEVRLYAVVPRTDGDDSLAFEKVIAPPLVRQGSVFPLRLVVRSNGTKPMRASLELAIDGQPVAAEAVDIDSGLNVFELQQRMPKSGSVRLRARVTTPDGRVDERKELVVPVTGPVRALLVTEEAHPALARALRLKDVEIDQRRPKEIPTLSGLLEYDCVIFDDVPRDAFNDAALLALDSYVRNFGGGLVFTGGARSFGDRGYAKSILERLLPVQFVAQQAAPRGRKPMGVFLVVDRSNSMSYSGSTRDVRNGEKIRYARQAALALVGQLRDEDHVGVIAFDAEPYVLGGLRPLRDHRAHLVDRIQHLNPGGGTDFKEALEIAGAQLAADELRVRHIILLTDGDSNRGASDHDPLIATLASLQISVTTLRIGLDDVNLELLRNISQRTQGTFYHVANLDELPELLVRDAHRADQRQPEPKGEASQAEGELAAALDGRSEVLRGFASADFPTVRNPVKTQAKPNADVALSVNAGSERLPLLATWQVGLGRAAAVPLDPSSPGAARWAAWPGYGKLWSQLIRWVMREQASWETRQTVRYDGDRAILEVDTIRDTGDATLEAELSISPVQKVSIVLNPIGPRAFRGTLPPVPPGPYLVKILRREGGRIHVQKSEMITIDDLAGAGDPSRKLGRRRPNLELLRDIAAETGGAVDPDAEEVTASRRRWRTIRTRLDVWLLPLAIGFVLADIALRSGARD